MIIVHTKKELRQAVENKEECIGIAPELEKEIKPLIQIMKLSTRKKVEARNILKNVNDSATNGTAAAGALAAGLDIPLAIAISILIIAFAIGIGIIVSLIYDYDIEVDFELSLTGPKVRFQAKKQEE